MSAPKKTMWVQHKSGGRIFKIAKDICPVTEQVFIVYQNPHDAQGGYYTLPRPDYDYVYAPSEQWEVCTQEVVGIRDHHQFLFVRWSDRPFGGNIPSGCRWAWDKDNPNALVIERKVRG